MELRDLGLAGFAIALAIWGGCASSNEPVNVATTGGDGGRAGHGASSSRASTSASTSASAGGGGAGGGASAAKQFYLDHVFHDLYDAPNSATDPRACGDCHGDPSSNGAPTYLEPDPEASYAVTTIYPGFLAAPSSSLLTTRGSIEHTGPGMNAAQLADVEQWLTMEAEERGLSMGTGGGGAGGGASGDSLEQAIEDYGACMDHALWLAPGAGVGLDKLPKATVMGGATCMSCHGAGMGGNWLSGDDDETFAKNKTFPYVLRQVTGTVDAMGSFDTLVSAKRWIDKGSEVCDPMVQTCHPKFTLSADLQAGINAFVNKTIQKWANHQCGAGGGGGAAAP